MSPTPFVLLTGKSNFSWANVAASAVTAGLGEPLMGQFNSDTFGVNLATNIGLSGIGYGVNKALGGDRSWNNVDVLSDAFGNALGNSIVSGLSKSPQPSKEDLERQAKLDAMSRQLGQDASKKVNGVLDANLAKTLGKAQETMAVDLNQTVDNFNNFSSAYAAYSSDYELNVAGQLSDYRVTRANDLTASYQAKANALTQRTEYYSPDNIYKRVFADDIATGMAMHAEGVRNRPQYGMDVKNAYDWDSAIKNADYLKKQAESVFDVGQTNAVEIEVTGLASYVFGGSGGSVAIAIQNNGDLVFARGGNTELHTPGDFGLDLTLGVQKGYGAKASDLAHGASETVYASLSLSDIGERIAGDKVGKLSRAKGVDFSVATEVGHTLDDFGKPQFDIEGRSMSASLGWKKANNIVDNMTLKQLPSMPLGSEIGYHYENAGSFTYDYRGSASTYNLGNFGRNVYAVFNNVFFRD